MLRKNGDCPRFLFLIKNLFGAFWLGLVACSPEQVASRDHGDDNIARCSARSTEPESSESRLLIWDASPPDIVIGWLGSDPDPAEPVALIWEVEAEEAEQLWQKSSIEAMVRSGGDKVYGVSGFVKGCITLMKGKFEMKVRHLRISHARDWRIVEIPQDLIRAQSETADLPR